MVAVAMAFKNYPLLICIYMEMQLFISGARSATADQGEQVARLEVCGRGVYNWLVRLGNFCEILDQTDFPMPKDILTCNFEVRFDRHTYVFSQAHYLI